MGVRSALMSVSVRVRQPGRTLILNLPGSPRGATESVAAVVALLPHALELLSGEDSDHPGA